MHVVAGIPVSYQFRPVCFASLRLQKTVYFSVGGENRSGRSQLRSHVRDHVAIHRGESSKAWAVILNDTADAAANIMPSQHFKDYVLRANPVRERSRKFDAPHFRHLDMKGLSRHGKRHFESAGAHRQHTDGPGGRRVAIRAQQSLTSHTFGILT